MGISDHFSPPPPIFCHFPATCSGCSYNFYHDLMMIPHPPPFPASVFHFPRVFGGFGTSGFGYLGALHDMLSLPPPPPFALSSASVPLRRASALAPLGFRRGNDDLTIAKSLIGAVNPEVKGCYLSSAGTIGFVYVSRGVVSVQYGVVALHEGRAWCVAAKAVRTGPVVSTDNGPCPQSA